MKKFLFFFISVFMAVPLSSCGYNETNDTHSEVVINLPTDNTLNGYRTEESSQTETETGEMPDKISVNETKPGSGGTAATTGNYVGNKNSRVFHKPNCSSIKKTKDENKTYFKERSDAVNQGYSPCKRCNP